MVIKLFNMTAYNLIPDCSESRVFKVFNLDILILLSDDSHYLEVESSLHTTITPRGIIARVNCGVSGGL